MKISISKDKMEAYITIHSIPKNTYKLQDSKPCKTLILKKVAVEKKYASKITPGEIRDELKERGIVFGVLDETINKICTEDNVNNVLIAKGVQPLDDVPEKLEILFKDSDQLKEISDTKDTVDYRNRFLLATVNEGDEIGRIVPAEVGRDGKDIFGNDVKRKSYTKVNFKIGEGCKCIDNRIISTTEGKPSFKYNIFKVNEVYKVEEVNLNTGNINFVADVEIAKAVAEGMEVISGNSVSVGGNVESAKIKAASDIIIQGNVLNSTIIAGENVVNRKKYLLDLNDVKNIIDELYSALTQVKESNLLGTRKIGELIKILIENKYKSLIPLCRQILDECNNQGIHDHAIREFINNRIIGAGPLSIEDEDELIKFSNLLEEEVDGFEDIEAYESKICLKYVQGSKIESMGSIIIEGKGQYTSDITALKDIEFTSDNAVCRGGMLSAGRKMKLKTVGSEAGVNTILKVPRDGVITADIVYNNTIFCFGEKQLVLESSSRNVKAYLDKMGDITIEKLKL